MNRAFSLIGIDGKEIMRGSFEECNERARGIVNFHFPDDPTSKDQWETRNIIDFGMNLVRRENHEII